MTVPVFSHPPATDWQAAWVTDFLGLFAPVTLGTDVGTDFGWVGCADATTFDELDDGLAELGDGLAPPDDDVHATSELAATRVRAETAHLRITEQILSVGSPAAVSDWLM